MRLSSWLSRFAGGKGASRRKRRQAPVEFPRLYDRRLERRRVLSATPVAPVAMESDTGWDAGAAAGDGMADTFRISFSQDNGETSVTVTANDQTLSVQPLDEQVVVTLQGSSDVDQLILESLLQSADPAATGPASESSSASPFSQISDVSYQIDLDSGVIEVTLTDSNESQNILTVVFSEFDTISDTLLVEDRYFDVSEQTTSATLTDSNSVDASSPQTQLQVAGGLTVQFQNPYKSLVVDTAVGNPLDSSSDDSPGQTLTIGASRSLDVDLSVQGDPQDTVLLVDEFHLASGDLNVAAGEIVVQGELQLEAGHLHLTATQTLRTEATAQITLGEGDVVFGGGQILHEGELRVAGERTITLDAGPTGELIVSGGLFAVGASPLETGGKIQLLGHQVGLVGEAYVDVSGAAGGGVALIGGGFQGADPQARNAARTYVGPAVRIAANALQQGGGGTVIVWSDETTRFYGEISATAPAGGRGGFAEVSGRRALDFNGHVSLASESGQGGTLLLDPAVIVITDDLTDGSPQPDAAFGDLGPTIITVGTLENITSDLVLQATHSIVIADLGTNVGDSTINLMPDVSLTLQTRNALGEAGLISFVDPNDSIKASGKGSISLIAGSEGATEASLQNLGSLETDGGDITLKASGDIGLNGKVVTSGGAVLVTADSNGSGAGAVSIDGSVDTGSAGGMIDVSGSTVKVNASVDAGADALTITATNGDINLADSSNILQADSSITLDAALGSILTDNASNAAEIRTDGEVTLVGQTIGTPSNGIDVANATWLVIHDTGGGSASTVEVSEISSGTIASTSITLADADSGTLHIDYAGSDVVTINNGHQFDSTRLDHDFRYTAAAGSISDVNTVQLSGPTASFQTRSVDESIRLDSLDATAVLSFSTSGSAGDVLVDNGATQLTLGASSVGGSFTATTDSAAGIAVRNQIDTRSANGLISLDAARGNIGLADVDDILTAGTGVVSLSAAGSIRAADPTADAGVEIRTSGVVLLNASTIGAPGNAVSLVEATALVVTDTGGGAGSTVEIEELSASSVATTNLTVADADSGAILIDFFGPDVLRVNNGHQLDASQLDHDFSYTALTGSISDVGPVLLTGSTASFAALNANDTIVLDVISATALLRFNTLGVSGDVSVDNGATALALGASSVGGSFTATNNHLAGITVAGQIDTRGANGPVTLTALMGDIRLADIDDLITTGAGDVSLNAAGGNINAAEATSDGGVEIRGSGSVQLTAQGIGTAANRISLADATTLTVNDTGGLGSSIDLEELNADTVTRTRIFVADADSGAINIDYFGVDSLNIGNGHQFAASRLDHDFSYATAAGDISDAGTLLFLGNLTLSTSSLDDILLDDVNNEFSAVTILDGQNATLRINNATSSTLQAITLTGDLSLLSGEFLLGGTQVIDDAVRLVIDTGILNLGGFAETVSGVRLVSGQITGATGVLSSVTDFELQSGSVDAVLGGSAGAIKTTPNAVVLTRDNLYAGNTTVAAGVLTVDGSTAASSMMTVNLGGTLSGHGAIHGVTLVDGGALAPGSGPGRLTTGSLTFNNGAQFQVDIDGEVAGVSHDQLLANGAVNLTDVSLVLAASIAPTGGADLVLIDNTTANPINGQFNGLPEATVINVGGVNALISYAGGDGNDVVLSVAGPAFYTETGAGADFVLRVEGADLRLYRDADPTPVFSSPLLIVTDFTLNGQINQTESLTIDYAAGGFFDVPVTFNAGAGGSDWLSVVGGAVNVMTVSPFVPDSGVIDLDGTLINYNGLNFTDATSLTTTIAANDVILQLPDGGVATQLSALGAGQIRLESVDAPPAFEMLDFLAPAQSLTILDGDGDDTIAIASLPWPLNADLTIDASGASNDSVQLNGGLNLGMGGLLIESESLDVRGNIFTNGGDVDFSGVSGQIDVNLAGATWIVDTDSTSDSVGAGDVNLRTPGTFTSSGVGLIINALGSGGDANGTVVLPQVLTADRVAASGQTIAAGSITTSGGAGAAGEIRLQAVSSNPGAIVLDGTGPIVVHTTTGATDAGTLYMSTGAGGSVQLLNAGGSAVFSTNSGFGSDGFLRLDAALEAPNGPVDATFDAGQSVLDLNRSLGSAGPLGALDLSGDVVAIGDSITAEQISLRATTRVDFDAASAALVDSTSGDFVIESPSIDNSTGNSQFTNAAGLNALILRPLNPGDSFGLGDASAAASVSDAFLQGIQNTFSRLEIGYETTQAGAIELNLASGVVIPVSVEVEAGGGAAVQLRDDVILTSANNSFRVLTSGGAGVPVVELRNGAAVQTAFGDIQIQGDVLVQAGSSSRLSSNLGAGDIVIEGDVLDEAGPDGNLLIISGSGNVTLGASGANQLGTVSNPFGQTVVIATGDMQVNSSIDADVFVKGGLGGTSTFAQPIVLDGSGDALFVQSENIVFLADVTTTNDGNVRLNGANTPTGSLTLANDTQWLLGGSFTEGDTADFAAGAQLGADIQSGLAIPGGIAFNSSITLTRSVNLDSNGSDIFLRGDVGGGTGVEALTLNAGGSGDIMTAALGFGLANPLGALTILSADEVSVGQIASSSTVDIVSSTSFTSLGAIDAGGDVQITATGDWTAPRIALQGANANGGNISLTGDAITWSGNLESTGGGAELTIQPNSSLPISIGGSGPTPHLLLSADDFNSRIVRADFSSILVGRADQTERVAIGSNATTIDMSDVTLRLGAGANSADVVIRGLGIFNTVLGAPFFVSGSQGTEVALLADVITSGGDVTIVGNTVYAGAAGETRRIQTSAAGAVSGEIHLDQVTLAALAADVRLELDVSNPTGQSGQVFLGNVADAGFNHLSALRVDLTGAAPGSLRLEGDVRLLGDAATPARFDVVGGSQIVVAPDPLLVANTGELLIDLSSQVDGVSGGSIDFGASDVVAGVLPASLRIDTSYQGPPTGNLANRGGDVLLGQVTTDGAGFLDALFIDMQTTDPAGAAGQLVVPDGQLLVAGTAGTGVEIKGRVLVDPATGLRISTNPLSANQDTGSINLVDAEIDGAGAVLLDSSGNGNALVAGDIMLGDVGNTIPVVGVSVDPRGIVQSGNLVLSDGNNDGLATIAITTGDVDFSNAPTVILTDDTLIQAIPSAAGQGNLLFAATANLDGSTPGAEDLSVILNGGDAVLPTIGANIRLGDLTVQAGAITLGGGELHISNGLLQGDVLLAGDTTISTDGNDHDVSIVGDINSLTTPSQFSVDVAAGAIAVDGVIGNTNPLAALDLRGATVELFDIGAAGGVDGVSGPVVVNADTLVLDGSNYRTSGSQSYLADTLLSGGGVTAFLSNGNDIRFGGTVDAAAPGGESLIIDAGSADVYLEGAVGGDARLGGLDVTANTLHLAGDILTDGSAGASAEVNLSLTTNLDVGGLTSLLIDTDETGGASDAGAILLAVNSPNAPNLHLTLDATADGGGLSQPLTLAAMVLDMLTVAAEAIESSGLVTAREVQLTANTGIGAIAPLSLDTERIDAATGVGPIRIGNLSGQPTIIDQLRTTLGQIQFIQSGSGPLSVEGPIETQGDIWIQALGDMQIGATAGIQSSGGDIDLISDNGALRMAPASFVEAGNGDIRVTAANDIVLSYLRTSGSNAGAMVVSSAAGGIEGTPAGNVLDANNGEAILISRAGVGNAQPLNTRVERLQVLNTGPASSGAIRINEADNLVIVQIDQDASGDTAITANGSIFVAGSVQATDGLLGLYARGAASDLVVDAPIQTSGGAIELVAGRHVAFTPQALVTSAGGQVTVAAGQSNSSGALLMFDGSLVDAGSGRVDVSAAGDVAVSEIVTTHAGSDALVVDSRFGAIVNNAPAATNLRVTQGTARLSALHGVGDGLALSLDAQGLLVNNSGFGASGEVWLNELNSITVASITQSSPGDVRISAGGDLQTSGDIRGAGGLVQLTSGGTIMMQDGSLINAADGDVILDAVGDVGLGGIRTASSSATAVRIFSLSGGVIDNGDTHLDVRAANGGLAIDALTGVGIMVSGAADAALETQVNSLRIANDRPGASGGVAIDERDSLRVEGIHVLGSTPGTNAVAVTAGGDLRLTAAGTGVSALGGGDVLLTASGVLSIADTMAADDILVDGSGHIIGHAGIDVVSSANSIIRTETGFIQSVRPPASIVPLDLGGPGINVDRFGNVALQIELGAGENFFITIDWNDFPSQGSLVNYPPTANSGLLGNGSGGSGPQYDGVVSHRFNHTYFLGNPTGDPTRDIPYSAQITYDYRGLNAANGIQFFVNGNPLSLTTSSDAQFTVPVQGITAAAAVPFQEQLRAAPLPTPEISAPSDPRRTVNEVSNDFDLEDAQLEIQSAIQQRVELRVVTPAGDEITVYQWIGKKTDIINQRKKLFEDLPDDRYRMYLIREDGTQQQISDVLLRNHKPYDPLDKAQSSPVHVPFPQTEPPDAASWKTDPPTMVSAPLAPANESPAAAVNVAPGQLAPAAPGGATAPSNTSPGENVEASAESGSRATVPAMGVAAAILATRRAANRPASSPPVRFTRGSRLRRGLFERTNQENKIASPWDRDQTSQG